MNENILNFISRRIPLLRALGLTDQETTDDEYLSVAQKLLNEQEEKNKITDQLLNYNDEIVDIEFVGEKETVDISVTGDSLFYCNGILTKNSIGLAATCDVICSLWQEEEDKELGIINIGFQKNRFGPNFGSAAFKCNYTTLTLSETNPDYFKSDTEEDDVVQNAENTLNRLSDE